MKSSDTRFRGGRRRLPAVLLMLVLGIGAAAIGWAGLVCTVTAGEPSGRPEAAPKAELGAWTFRMPGESYQGPLPALTETQTRLRASLQRDVTKLAGGLGERNLRRPHNYKAAAKFIEHSLGQAEYEIQAQTFSVGGLACVNLEVELAGGPLSDEILVIGAHYDSARGTPGANDNATGVAALLALARDFVTAKPQRTVRFVFFANEETPYFQTGNMGSLVYAKRCRARGEKLVGMISLETIGYYSDKKDSQRYPPPFNLFYPSTGNFIGFVGDSKSRPLVETCVASFRKHAKFPSEGGAIPSAVQGVGWSDHWSFWQVGYPALMVTDTAPFRYPHYHLASDTPDKVDYARMARVVAGLQRVITDLANPRSEPADR